MFALKSELFRLPPPKETAMFGELIQVSIRGRAAIMAPFVILRLVGRGRTPRCPRRYTRRFAIQMAVNTSRVASSVTRDPGP